MTHLSVCLSVYVFMSLPTHCFFFHIECALSVVTVYHYRCLLLQLYLSLSLVFLFLSHTVQTQSPVLQSNMLVPIATESTPPHPSISLVAPPLPVQNGPTTASKVRVSTF